MPGECSHESARAGSFPHSRVRRQIGRVNATPSDSAAAPFSPAAPPYAVTTPTFRFRALASLAGRAPLGGTREVVLATYLVARLVDDCRPSKALLPAIRGERSNAARSWLANTTLPAPVRVALTRLAESTEGELAVVAGVLAGAMTATAPYLDDAARRDLERLARAITP